MRLSASAVCPVPAAGKSGWLKISLFEGAGVIDEDPGTEGELDFLAPAAGRGGELLFLVPGAETEAPAEFPAGPAGVLPEATFELLSGCVREAFSSSATM